MSRSSPLQSCTKNCHCSYNFLTESEGIITIYCVPRGACRGDGGGSTTAFRILYFQTQTPFLFRRKRSLCSALGWSHLLQKQPLWKLISFLCLLAGGLIFFLIFFVPGYGTSLPDTEIPSQVVSPQACWVCSSALVQAQQLLVF